jgi:hypothetical protein
VTGATIKVEGSNAFQIALDKARPGDTVLLADGSYASDSGFVMTGVVAGPNEDHVIIKAVNPGKVTLSSLKGDGLILDGCEWIAVVGLIAYDCLAGFRVSNCKSVRLIDCGGSRAKLHGALTENSPDTAIARGKWRDSLGGHGVCVAAGSDAPIFTGSEHFGNSGYGIMVTDPKTVPFIGDDVNCHSNTAGDITLDGGKTLYRTGVATKVGH